MATHSLPANSVALSLADVARATGGELRGSADLALRGVSTDSRADLRGKLFGGLTQEGVGGVLQRDQFGRILRARRQAKRLPRVQDQFGPPLFQRFAGFGLSLSHECRGQLREDRRWTRFFEAGLATFDKRLRIQRQRR